jgi:hypothetical protein
VRLTEIVVDEGAGGELEGSEIEMGLDLDREHELQLAAGKIGLTEGGLE